MQLSRFAKYAWFVVGYTILVILWGAVVRATGSGAGCGSHWPSCNGEIVHQPASTEATIELAHRLTSAFAGVLVIILLIGAYRAFAKGSPVRRMAVFSLIFILIEGALGALLVRLELTADNASALRAVMISLHLINTWILLTFLTLTAWYASGAPAAAWRTTPGAGGRALRWLLGSGLGAAAVMGAMGAVTALGDTLFPSTSLTAGLAADLDPTAHFLIRLRVFHPVAAILVSVFWLAVAGYLRTYRPTALMRKTTRTVQALILIQLGVGVVNVLLLAPVWMQVVHLLLADLFWIALVCTAATALSPHPEAAAAPAPAERLLHASNGQTPRHGTQRAVPRRPAARR